MKKLLSLFVIPLISCGVSYSQNYICKDGYIRFFSTTPMEDIEGISKEAVSVLNTSTNDIVFKVTITSFKFNSSLMQDHFNENYMESGKYPTAVFKGKINEKIDWAKDGTYNISATGTMNCHGTDKQIIEKGTLTISKGTIIVKTSFKMKLEDYKVEIPQIVFNKIAESVDVTTNSTYLPYVKK